MNLAYAIVVTFGALVGVTELLTRYRDAPSALWRVPSAWFYVVINAVASAAALLAIHVFGWEFGGATLEISQAYQILIAGFGSAALFRSALFLVKVGGSNVAVGPNLILSGLLEAADRGVDRVRAKKRAEGVAAIMADVSFEKSHIALPTYCLALLQNVAPADQLELRESVEALNSADDIIDEHKSLTLGLALLNIGGIGVLEAAVKALGSAIRKDDVATASNQGIHEIQLPAEDAG
jgi:hypothetical protein